jgi:hypothetical protein
LDEDGFRIFLKKGGRSKSAIERCLRYVKEFQNYLHEHRGGKRPDDADPEDLKAFVEMIEGVPKASANTHLWALRYYYECTSNEGMRSLAADLREERIKRAPFVLGKFRGVNPEHIDRLADANIKNVEQMLKAGRTQEDRRNLSEETGVPIEAILELVKLSDISRIPGIKTIRARLYLDAGVDTIEKMAGWDPEELRAVLVEFVDRTGFNGLAPLPGEARFSVERARELPKIVEY